VKSKEYTKRRDVAPAAYNSSFISREDGERGSETYAAGSYIPCYPFRVSIALFLEREHGFELILEGEVECLSGEITNHIRPVTSPQRYHS
jgi:hypothetical protein